MEEESQTMNREIGKWLSPFFMPYVSWFSNSNFRKEALSLEACGAWMGTI